MGGEPLGKAPKLRSFTFCKYMQKFGLFRKLFVKKSCSMSFVDAPIV